MSSRPAVEVEGVPEMPCTGDTGPRQRTPATSTPTTTHKQRASASADRHDEASILFADMAGFTSRASDTAPTRWCGSSTTSLPASTPDHSAALGDLPLDMREALDGLTDPNGRAVLFRMGMASG
jgi:hypothetical protein